MLSMKMLGKMKRILILLTIAGCFLAFSGDAFAVKEGADGEATLVVPVEVLAGVIREALPLELETSESLKGRLWVRSVEKLYLGKNAVSFKARVQGKELAYIQKIGGYKAAVKFGEVDLAFDCSASLSFDRKRRVLVIKPRIHPAEKGNELLTPLLMALVNENEYLVEIEKLKPIETRLGKSPLVAHMDVSSITTLNNKLMIGITPRIEKSGGK